MVIIIFFSFSILGLNGTRTRTQKSQVRARYQIDENYLVGITHRSHKMALVMGVTIEGFDFKSSVSVKSYNSDESLS